MRIDAIALVRPKTKTDEAFGKHPGARKTLADGNVLFDTSIRYDGFVHDPTKSLAFLQAAVGRPLGELHDDPRGLLLFPSGYEPRATTYDGIVAELSSLGDPLWLPLDGTPPKARPRLDEAPMSREEHEATSAKLGELMTKGSSDPLTLAECDYLAGKLVRAKPDAKVWCVLVKRKTKLPSEKLQAGARDVATLLDGATAIHGSEREGLSKLAWRLADVHGEWVAEHDDDRGVPAFEPDAFDAVRTASSYAEAVDRLGDRVRWVVPKGHKPARRT